MSIPETISVNQTVYLQPTGWCAPDYANPQTWVQIAGLPVWASAVRVIVRGYKGREHDCVLPTAQMPKLLTQWGRDDALRQWKAITSPRAPWRMGGKDLSFSRPQLMAILNATPDSFSDGGDHVDPLMAIAAAQTMVQDGADILDIGGESTRPGAKTVWEGDEIERVLPILQGCQSLGAVLSLDTRKASVMKVGLSSGAQLINDVSALTYDDDSLRVVAERDCPVVLMHAQGDPQSMQKDPCYDDVVLDVYDALLARLEVCLDAGIGIERIAIDPGVGFGKTLQHNLSLINNLAIFHGLGCPILLGVSRKRFIGALAGEDDPKKRLAGSLACAVIGLDQGVHILRVHDVAETRQMLDVWGGMRDGLQMPNATLLAEL